MDLTSRSYISERIILPLIVTEDVKDIISTVQTTVVMEETDIEKIKSALLFGSALVVLYDNVTTISALCPADEGGGKIYREPNSDVTIRGPRAGFTEDYEKNVAAIRRIIRNENLAFEEFTLKGNTHTRVVLSYIEGVANENVVKCIRQKLTSLDAVGIVDSANLEMFISGRMLFPIFGSTEKVDKFASKLLSGRVGIIVDAFSVCYDGAVCIRRKHPVRRGLPQKPGVFDFHEAVEIPCAFYKPLFPVYVYNRS